MKSKLYGVGVGPGDSECLTLKAVRIIKECDVIALPCLDKENCLAYKIAGGAIEDIDDKEFLFIDMPMMRDVKLLKEAHSKGADKIEQKLKEGKNIAFLTLGDPTVYSTYIYIHRIIIKRGYSTEIINGITSFTAVAAALNDGLVQRSEELHIIPGSYEVSQIKSLKGTKVLMKAGKKISKLRDELKKDNIEGKMVSNCTMKDQKIFENLDFPIEDASYYSIIVLKDKDNDLKELKK